MWLWISVFAYKIISLVLLYKYNLDERNKITIKIQIGLCLVFSTSKMFLTPLVSKEIIRESLMPSFFKAHCLLENRVYKTKLRLSEEMI